MSAAADEVRVPCGAKYPDTGAAHVVRPDVSAAPCASTRFLGASVPLAGADSSKHDADINFSSPDDAWWTSDRWSISDVMARAREIEDLGYVSLFHGDA